MPLSFLTFSDSSFNSFSTSMCLVFFEVTFLFKFYSLSSKSAIPALVANFACANLALKLSAVN